MQYSKVMKSRGALVKYARQAFRDQHADLVHVVEKIGVVGFLFTHFYTFKQRECHGKKAFIQNIK